MHARATWFVAAFAVALTHAACERRFEGAGELRAQTVALQREVQGLRETVARLERHETILPADDVAVAVEESLVRDIISAQLPFDADIDRYHLRLTRADVSFQDSQVVRLRGSLYLRGNPGLSADVSAVGALDKMVIDASSSTLTSKVALDHISIQKAAGLETILSESALERLARTVRLEIADQLPTVQIPVRIQRTIDVPSFVAGPIRVAAASLPLQVSVSRVVAGRGRLWIAIQIKPGEFVKADAR